MHRLGLPLACVVLLAHTTTAAAQSGPGGWRLPAVDSMLPDVTVYDERGEEFSTRSLRGHYSVLVFGCLT